MLFFERNGIQIYIVKYFISQHTVTQWTDLRLVTPGSKCNYSFPNRSNLACIGKMLFLSVFNETCYSLYQVIYYCQVRKYFNIKSECSDRYYRTYLFDVKWVPSIKTGTRKRQFSVRYNWQSLLGNSTATRQSKVKRVTYRWLITGYRVNVVHRDWKTCICQWEFYIWSKPANRETDIRGIQLKGNRINTEFCRIKISPGQGLRK